VKQHQHSDDLPIEKVERESSLDVNHFIKRLSQLERKRYVKYGKPEIRYKIKIKMG